MRKTKKFVTYILAFILTIGIIACLFSNLISSTIMKKQYILHKLDEIDYYSKVNEVVEQNFEKYIGASGLEEEVIKNIVTKEKIEMDTKQILTNMYDGLEEKISTDEIAENLNTNIKKSLHGRELSKNEEEAVKKFIQKICNEYESTILHTKYESTINKYYTSITKYIRLFTQGSMIITGLTIIALILINVSRFYRAINAVGVSLLSSGAILSIANIYLNMKINVGTITILNEMFSTLLRKILSEILENVEKYGLLFVISGVVLIITSNLIHNIQKYGLKEKLGEK